MDDLERNRIFLEDFFEARAKSSAISLSPRRDPLYLNSVERLYEGYSEDRAFFIDYEPDNLIVVDLFFREIEIDGSKIWLLNVGARLIEENAALLWDIYRAWMHDRKTMEEIERLFPIKY
jgi:hypothetical protein